LLSTDICLRDPLSTEVILLLYMSTGCVSSVTRVALNFGFGKSEIRPFFPKFGFGQISGQIWQTPMQLQCVQLVT